MIDPDLKTELDQINKSLTAIEGKKSGGVWRAFFNGMFGALGYIAGLVIVVLILGWVLQRMGWLQAFQDRVKDFNNIIDQAQKLISPAPTPSSKSTNQSGSGGFTTVTLPSGQQIQVKTPAGY
jgi:hypothetical protein